MKNNNNAHKTGYPKGFCEPHLLSGIEKDTPILVGFSGGADSRALLDLICRYARQNETKIYAAHVNHGIRGEEADRDEAFCKDKAKEYGIELFVHKVDIPALAKESGKSVELAARDERYAFFANVMKEHSIPLLATAHNANDNLETVIFNLTRGSGLSGHCVIPPKRECDGGMLIRPILSMSREEILEYCKENSLDYVIDSTNLDTEYTRNKIRSRVIPTLKELNPSVEESVFATTSILRDDAELLDKLADDLLKENADDNGALPLKAINCAHRSLSSRAVRKMYAKLAEDSLEQVHAEAILSLCKRGVAHSHISLPNGVFALIENAHLVLTDTVPKRTEKVPFFIKAEDGNNPISQINAEIVIGKSHKPINIYKKSIQFCIDSAKINGTLVIRSKNDGDKIFMGGMHKSIKKLMCEKKIELEYRSRLPIICDDDGIVAVPFVGICDRCRTGKTSGNTKTILFYLY